MGSPPCQQAPMVGNPRPHATHPGWVPRTVSGRDGMNREVHWLPFSCIWCEPRAEKMCAKIVAKKDGMKVEGNSHESMRFWNESARPGLEWSLWTRYYCAVHSCTAEVEGVSSAGELGHWWFFSGVDHPAQISLPDWGAKSAKYDSLHHDA